ncbi:MAG: alpha/beta family hydrolase, partial [Gemmatimonadota bacterium]
MSNTREWRIPVGPESTTAIYVAADGVNRAGTLICAHGAGGHLGDRAMLRTAHAMQGAGLNVVRFNFLYKERKAARPDPMPKLMDTVAAVVEYARKQLGAGSLFLGGRSMGGRAASMLAAEGFACDGLILLAYPLHPPGQLDKLRDAHLPRITAPVLCFNGTRDEFCEPDLMKRVLTGVQSRWTMQWLEGADHSFHVLKRSGRTDADVMEEVRRATADWLADAPRR